jgi:metal-responsive CopG/Arc/MetJ family transcriptional regulator
VPDRTVRTTVALPADLIAAVDRVVREGRARSRSALLATALKHELAALDRSALDAAFAPLADDLAYQSEAITLSEEFAAADWEALQLGEDQE